MNTAHTHQKQNVLSSFRLRIIATYVILCAGVAVYWHYRHPLLLPAMIVINLIIRQVIRPVFPRPSDRANLFVLIGVILFGVIVFTVEPPLRDILLGALLLPAVFAGLYSDYRLFRIESHAIRDAS